MGNSAYPKAQLKSAITEGDLEQLTTLLTEWENSERLTLTGGQSARSCAEFGTIHSSSGTRDSRSHRIWLLSQALNKRGDPPLTLAIRNGHSHLMTYLLECGSVVNTLNKDGESALDVLLNKALPDEGDILHNHFCLYPHATKHNFLLPEDAKVLLRSGGKGPSLHKLILHAMKEDEGHLREISELICNLSSDNNFRLSGLLLQVSVWFERTDTLIYLLETGVDPENFWRAPFIPTIVPNSNYQPTVGFWETISNETEGEYVLSSPDKATSVDSSMSLQSLKLSFVQDWRAEWYDGENPEAQYRAGLVLTTEGATFVIKAANNYSTLCHVVHDIMEYLPPLCGGPNLKESSLFPYLVLAGYVFRDEEVIHLRLKYSMDFAPYTRYSKQPKSLKHLCRLCIRSSFTQNVYYSAPKLHCLPAELRDYLLLNDIDKCIIEE